MRDFSAALPLDPVREDYRLIPVADSKDGVAETSEENNPLAFSGGAFRTACGALHVHGIDLADFLYRQTSISVGEQTSVAIQVNDDDTPRKHPR